MAAWLYLNDTLLLNAAMGHFMSVWGTLYKSNTVFLGYGVSLISNILL